MANRRTLDEQIDAALKERDQKEKRIKELLARRRSKEDKDRTHRLCRRGGLVEKLHPRLAKINDEEFSLFVEMVLKTGHTKRILDEIMPPEPEETEGSSAAPQGSNTSAGKTNETAAQPAAQPTPKSAQTPQNAGTNGNAHSASKPPQNGNDKDARPANTPQGSHNNGNSAAGNGAQRTS